VWTGEGGEGSGGDLDGRSEADAGESVDSRSAAGRVLALKSISV